MSIVMPTQQMAGVTGYMTLVIPETPNGVLTAAQLAGTNPSLQVLVQPNLGNLAQVAQGAATGVSQSLNWLTAGGSATFFLCPVDSAGNAYAPVESLQVQGQPGIYASPSAPTAAIAQLQAANPGLQVYGGLALNSALPPSSTASTIGDWITANPMLAGGAALVLVLLVSRMK